MEVNARQILDRCAKAAVRARGYAEPNPLVGCAITSADGRVLGIGHHERVGGPHAEINALWACAACGERTDGATAWVTLEPCGHHGRTPPCAEALIEAGIARVVYAREDPQQGGRQKLRAAGIETELCEASDRAVSLSDPFMMRTVMGRPWVTVKWAQSIDGKVATRCGDSQWISNERSRRMVHRMRGRADVILTGIGTVLADDPMLTARGVRVRRVAARVVIDPELETPTDCNLVRSARESEVMLLADPDVFDGPKRERAAEMEQAGINLQRAPMADGRIDLRAALTQIANSHDATNVFVEAGAGIAGELHTADLIDELAVFTAPFVLGDPHGMDPARSGEVTKIAHPDRMRLDTVKRIGDDVFTRYRRIWNPIRMGDHHLV